MSERSSLSSSVEGVMVFRRGAIVRRRVDVPQGLEKARVHSLPLSLIASTLRVRAEGTSVSDAAVVLALGAGAETTLPARDEALIAAKNEERLAATRIAATQRIIEDLKTLAVKPRARAEGESPVPLPSTGRTKLITFRREQLERRQGELVELQEQHRRSVEVRKDLEDKRRRLGSAIAARENELRKAVDISLDGNAGTLWIEYMVQTASWRPSYVLRLREDLRQGTLEARAVVAQNSGEDWEGATLRLSTAVPQAHAELPVLRSIRIGRQQPPPATRGYRPPPTGVDMLFQDYDTAFQAAEPEAAPEPKPMPVARPVSMGEGGAPPMLEPTPPPSPQAAPAPGAPAMAKSMRAMSGAADFGAAPKKRKRSRRAEKRVEVVFDEMPMESEAYAVMDDMGPEPSGPLRPGDEWLDFGNLRMPSSSEPGRGKLQRDGALGLPSGLGAGRAQKLTARASTLALSPEPPGHSLPRPVQGFDYSFDVVGSATIPSNGKWIAVPLDDAKAESSPRFVCVPRESREVFRFVDVVNPLEAPLLSGPLDIYVGGRFLLGRSMPVVGPGETLQLGLGVEQRIKVGRNVRYEENVAGMLRGSLELEHSLEVEILSYVASDALLEVRERVPVIREEEDDIEVDVIRSEPAWTPYKGKDDDLRGGFQWRLPLRQGEKHILKATYSIKIASKHELVGGNRRDS